MPRFSEQSSARLSTCHHDLRLVFSEVIKVYDCTVLEGIRSRETQAEYVRQGRSRTMNSKHLRQSDGTSHAVDVAPYPIDWKDSRRFAFLAGLVFAISERLRAEGRISHRVVWGGDWDSDGNLREHSFWDGPHFQLDAT